MSQTTMRKKILASCEILGITAVWGVSFVVMKNAMTTLPPLWFLTCRFAFALVLLALLNIPKLKTLRGKHIRDAFILGIPLAFGYAMQTLGLNLTTASNSAFITGTYVVIIPLLGWLVTHRLQIRQLRIALIACIGLAALSLDANLQIHIGDLLVLAGAVGYAIHFLLLDQYTKGYDSLLITGLQVAACTVFLAIAALLFEPIPTVASFPPTVCQSLLFTAIFCTVLGFWVQSFAQKSLPPTTASILFTSESVFGALFGVLLLHEQLLPRQIGGGILLIACMVASVTGKPEASPAAPNKPVPVSNLHIDDTEASR